MQTPCCRAGGEHFGPVLCDSVDARRVRKGMSVLAGCLEPLESFRRARRGHPKVVEIKGAAKEKELLKRAVIDLRQEQHSVRYVPEGVHVPDAVVGVFGQEHFYLATEGLRFVAQSLDDVQESAACQALKKPRPDHVLRYGHRAS